MTEYDPNKPKVFGIPAKGLVGVVAKDPTLERTMSIRFDPKYVHQLALDLLDMAEHVEEKTDG
jgi:hypothetical protein